MYTCAYTRGNLLWELAHMIVDAEKSGTWKAEKLVASLSSSPKVGELARCNLSLRSKPESPGCHLCKYLSPQPKGHGVLMSKGKRRKVSQLQKKVWRHLSSACLFYWGPQLAEWCLPHRPVTEDGFCLLTSLIQMPDYSRNTSHRYPEIIHYQPSEDLNPVKLTPKINCHSFQGFTSSNSISQFPGTWHIYLNM